ncbi:alpha/beta hydrolase [Zhihengliuella alba]|uniref:Alpha/beta hydrolase n=1 Tax=Zhihengliuella alba TaxID=547018 RepID=A0ABP7E2T0_9MICC
MIRELLLDGPHGELPVRAYLPAGAEASDGGARAPRPTAAPALVWAHGGAFAVGDLDMPEADWLARQLAGRGIAVVSVDYRLAPLDGQARWGGAVRPGVHFPVALEELAFVHAWARERAEELGADPARVAIGGASAGANLAAGATLRLLADRAAPWRVLLAYPTLHAVQPPVGEELRRALAAAGRTEEFAPAAVRSFYENYLGPAGPAEDAPLEAVPGTGTASQLADFPPSSIAVAEIDELRVSAEAFAATLREAGVDVDLAVEPGATHGYLNRSDEEPGAASTVERFASRLLGRSAG